jgi:cytochrome c2
MSMWRASALAPVAAIFLVRLAGIVLGLRTRRDYADGQQAKFDPQAHLAGIRVPEPSRIKRWSIYLGFALVLLTAAGIYAGYQLKSARDARTHAIALTSGDPDFGRRLTQRYGCAGCHTIPGVPGAQGKVGPTLQGFAARVYIGGVATNSPDTLIQWIENPRAIDPKTAMPITGISRAEARHVAAYLYTLR